jgi:ATP-binding cassette subfamily C protein
VTDQRRHDEDTADGSVVAAGLAALFDGAGRTVEAGASNPFVLAGDAVWLITQGQVDIFSVRADGDRPVGPRTHLVRVEAGGALFGLDVPRSGPERRLLAVGLNGTQLIAADASAIFSRAQQAGLSPLIDRLTEGWVDALCTGMARDVLVPKKCVELEPGAEVAFRPNTSARLSPAVCWIKHLEGCSWLLGRDGLEVNGHGFTPLSRRTWLHVREPARAILLRTDALPDAGERQRGLGRLHELTLRYAELVDTQTAVADAARMRQRTAARMTGLSQTCARLAATMQPERRSVERVTADMAAETAAEALLASCRLVGEAVSVAVRAPAAQQGAPAARDPLAAILRASRLRARKVALRDLWWRADAGALLGSIEEDKRPIALLPAADGYRLHDPLRGTVERVTAANAAALAPFAHTFYRPFPDKAIGVKDLLRFGVRGCSSDLTIVMLMGLGGMLLGMVPSIATGMLFNSIIPGAQRTQLVQIAVAMALVNLQRGIAILRVQAKMGNQIQSAVWDRLLALPLSFFRPYTAGNLAVRAGAIDSIRQVVSGATLNALLSGIMSLGNFCLMFYYSAAMAWWATATIAAAVIVHGLGCYLQIGYNRAVLGLQARTSGLVLQLLTSVGKLRVAGADVPAFALWGKGFGDQRALQLKARRIGNLMSAFSAAFPLLAYLFIFWAAQPAAGARATLGTGDFLAFLAAFASCLSAALSTSMAFLSTLSAIPLYEQAAPILKTLPEVDGDKAEPGILSGDIEIQHAVFRYRTDGPLVLRDVTLHVNAGEFVAFVGPSGSGKSTLLRLMLGFDQLESGSIYYDGQDLGGLDIQAVRRQIGVVLQSGRLMSGDILTNIVGSGAGTIEEAWEAARMAGLADDIKAMPMGMHTVISEGGGTLSGGQRQRLLIARAIVSRPRILLFDEATSALDNRTQAIVSASLERLQATRIVVAHRLSTIVNADRICVIERGRIVEMGRHQELMAANGLYTELAKRQLA